MSYIGEKQRPGCRCVYYAVISVREEKINNYNIIISYHKNKSSATPQRMSNNKIYDYYITTTTIAQYRAIRR